MHGLSRTIDGAVGIDHHLTRLPTTSFIKAILVITSLLRTGLVCIRIGKDLTPSALTFKEALAFGVGGQMITLLSGQTRIDTHPHIGIADGLSGRGFYHHDTHVIVRL